MTWFLIDSEFTMFIDLCFIYLIWYHCVENISIHVNDVENKIILYLVSRFALTKIFEKKNKCVSIDSKCSEMHRNAKKNFYPFDSKKHVDLVGFFRSFVQTEPMIAMQFEPLLRKQCRYLDFKPWNVINVTLMCISQ